jgi:predicted permease
MPRPDEELPLSPLKPVDEDVRQELRDHIERRTEDLVAQGWNAGAARAEAVRAFGNLGDVSAECREITRQARRRRQRSDRWSAFVQDVMFALRLLRRSPAFTAVAIATLALGVGANNAVFSAIDQTFLRPLPYDHPDRIVMVSELHTKGSAHIPWTNFLDIRAQNRSFDVAAQYQTARTAIVGGDVPLLTTATAVSDGFFRVFGVRPMLGRLPLPEDQRAGAAPVAVVSYRYWRDHMGSNRNLDATPLRGAYHFVVVGVMPPSFAYPDATDLWYPLELEQQPASRTAHNSFTVARLAAGSSPAAAERDLGRVAASMAALAGADYDATGFRPTRLQDVMTRDMREPLFLLFGAAALLLLIACINLASTLLARGATRMQELAVRTAIGAGRIRIARQLLTESLVIAIGGSMAGLMVSIALGRAFRAIAPPALAASATGAIDWRMLGFALGLGVATALLFGFIPAIRMSAIDVGMLMRAGARTTAARARIWAALIIMEVALAVVLLVGSTLLIRSFADMMRIDLGFNADNVVTASIDLAEQAYPDMKQAVVYHDRALEAVRAIRGVSAAGVTLNLPLGSGPDGGIEVEGRPHISTVYPITGTADYRIVSTGYFRAMQTSILRGRDFAETDDANAPMVALVNQAFARANWPAQDPMGKRFRVGGMDAPGIQPWATVIGVVHDVPSEDVTKAAGPAYFFSYRQVPYRARWLTLVARVAAPATAIPAIRSALLAIDPNAPPGFAMMTDKVASSVADRRFLTLLLSAFAGVALLLAALGIYGVVSYSVAQQSRDIGIRIALGAHPRRVQLAVQGTALRTVAIGVAVGIVAALAGSRLVSSLVYGVSVRDPMTFGATAGALLVTAAIASWIPARRGARIDPIAAIRGE